MNGRALGDRAIEVSPSSARILERAAEILTPFPVPSILIYANDSQAKTDLVQATGHVPHVASVIFNVVQHVSDAHIPLPRPKVPKATLVASCTPTRNLYKALQCLLTWVVALHNPVLHHVVAICPVQSRSEREIGNAVQKDADIIISPRMSIVSVAGLVVLKLH